MSLRRWDVVFLWAEEKDPTGHPAVVLSGENTLADLEQHRFNVLLGTKKPPAAGNAGHHVVLDDLQPLITQMGTDKTSLGGFVSR